MRAGDVLEGRYELVTPLGAGGFGEVWKARDPRVDRHVAVKILHRERGESSQEAARFAREAAAAGRLAHPNIVTIHDFSSVWHEGHPLIYLVMELVPGQPLSSRIATGRLAPAEAVGTALCVAQALTAAHAAGLVHRDIKPSNVILCPGSAKVVDFGIARGHTPQHNITTEGRIVGTPAYMAPECFSGRFDHRSDLYSLGCLLFEMCAGSPPFQGTLWDIMRRHLSEPPPSLASVAPDVPPELQQLVTALLAKSPEDRFSDASTVASRLRSERDRLRRAVREERSAAVGTGHPPADQKKAAEQQNHDARVSRGTGTASRGKDIETEVSLSAAEAADGCLIPLRITSKGPCEACAGTGSASRSPRLCPECIGTGVTAGPGSSSCSHCEGRGLVALDPCGTCTGRGRAATSRTIQARFPAGIRAGQRIRLAGQGAPGPGGGEPGDLYVHVKVDG
ncbi:protein kinase domain-containing protein [Streptomyces longispororuber]|uniref:protein kinase domain-containing protein n=1 Tax=Streptomyces longispororuber TaxID=68230 RepID=UPI0021098FAD|nr:protein kinase [Streptomyces longispororuber]MCQ4206436.1 protein kinase [Streptomyces longispororuber]